MRYKISVLTLVFLLFQNPVSETRLVATVQQPPEPLAASNVDTSLAGADSTAVVSHVDARTADYVNAQGVRFIVQPSTLPEGKMQQETSIDSFQILFGFHFPVLSIFF